MSDQYPPPRWSREQSWHNPYQDPNQDLYQDRGRGPYQAEPGVWQFGASAASGHRRGRRSGGSALTTVTIGVVALVVLVAAWVILHRGHSIKSTPVTATITIPKIHATWAPPPPGAAPALTAEQAWLKWSHQGRWSHSGPVGMIVQLGLITQPMGTPKQCGFVCDGLPVRSGIAYRTLNQLAYGFYWTACPPGSNLPLSSCWQWTFVNANTAKIITGATYDGPSLRY